MSTKIEFQGPTSLVQTIKINGTSLHGIGHVEQVWEGVLGAPELFGSAIHAPLRPGALHIPQVIGPREFGVGMLLHGDYSDDEAGHNNHWRTLARLVWSPTHPLFIERVIAIGTGTETQECSGQYIDGLAPEYSYARVISKVALRFLNLDGYWYGQSNSVGIVSAGSGTTLNMPGDAETRRMTITLSGGGSGVQTLTNSTNGCVLSYTGGTNPDVDIDVFAFTAEQGGVNVMKNVTHGGDVFWMRLEPGINALTLSGSGTATVRARAAYL